MEEAHKTFATKKQVDNAFDLADKNFKKVKKTSDAWFKLLYW